MVMDDGMKQQIEQDIKNNKVVLYMKGEPQMPMCGFSAKVVEVLGKHGAEYVSRNILENEVLRQSIKEFSNWPTIPQLYVNGEFVGGCDVILQLDQSGELEKILA
jgi:monothiol glutaredoxin